MQGEKLGFGDSAESTLGTFVKPIEFMEGLYSFLATHPVAVGVRNLTSVSLGEGGTIGLDYENGSVGEAFKDLLRL